MLLDLTPHARWHVRQMLSDPCRTGREAGPVVLEIGVVEAEHHRYFDHVDESDLTPEVRLSVRPHDRAALDLRTEIPDSLIEDSARVQHEVENGKATPEIKGATGHDAAWSCHSSHLGSDQIDIRDHVDDQGRDAGIERVTRVPQVACVAMLVGDTWV